MGEGRNIIPVWFFIGVLLLIYGILIMASGISEWAQPPDTVLARLHAPIWWGAFMIVIGGTYVRKFFPRKS